MNIHIFNGLSRKNANVKKSLFVRDFKSVLRKSKNGLDETGAMLVEVLVAMLILVIVFTTAMVAMSNAADSRTNVEQRDRALAILLSYEQETRIFRCGFAVDRNVSSLAKDLSTYKDVCAFSDDKNNIGDQSFTKEEKLNPFDANSPVQKFDIDIRYWWEVPGWSMKDKTCNDIKVLGADDDPENDQPLILARAIRVSWQEKGARYSEDLVKRDPTPADNVVFAVGARVSILSDVSSVPEGGSVTYQPQDVSDTDIYQKRIIDGTLGQPTKCAWFPYLTPDVDESVNPRKVNGSPVQLDNSKVFFP